MKFKLLSLVMFVAFSTGINAASPDGERDITGFIKANKKVILTVGAERGIDYLNSSRFGGEENTAGTDLARRFEGEAGFKEFHELYGINAAVKAVELWDGKPDVGTPAVAVDTMQGWRVPSVLRTPAGKIVLVTGAYAAAALVDRGLRRKPTR